MANSDYVTIIGFVPFDITTREVNGEAVRDVTVRDAVSGDLIKCTVWSSFDDIEVYKGDLVAIEGKLSVREYKGNKYFNLDTKRLVNLGGGSIDMTPAEEEPAPRKTRKSAAY